MHRSARLALSASLTGVLLYLFILQRHLPGPVKMIFANPEFWVAVGFVAVLGVFVYVGVPRMVGRMLDARAAAIKAELDEAKHLREEATGLLANYRAKAAAAEKEAEAILIEAKAEAERFAAEARAVLRSELLRRTQMAQDKIAQAETQAMNDIRAAAADIAVAAAEKLIAARLDDNRAASLVEQSIKDLPERLN